MIGAGAAALGALGGAIGGFQEIIDLFEASPEPKPRPLRPVKLDADELGTVTNERFGFSFGYPLSWDRVDAFNTDGTTFEAPEAGVTLTAYGSTASLGPRAQPDRLDYLVREERRTVATAGGRILRDADLRLVPRENAGRGQGAAAGYRLVHRAGPPGRRSPTSVVLLTTSGDRDVTIRCEAPTERYSAYVGASNRLLSTLRLTR